MMPRTLADHKQVAVSEETALIVSLKICSSAELVWVLAG